MLDHDLHNPTQIILLLISIDYSYMFFFFQEFIKTLDEGMARRLCVRSLRRGVVSMDYISGLLIREDDLDEDDTEGDVTPTTCTSREEEPSCIGTDTPDPAPPSGGTVPPSWCNASAIFAKSYHKKLRTSVVHYENVSPGTLDLPNCALILMCFRWPSEIEATLEMIGMTIVPAHLGRRLIANISWIAMDI